MSTHNNDAVMLCAVVCEWFFSWHCFDNFDVSLTHHIASHFISHLFNHRFVDEDAEKERGRGSV